MRLNRRELLVSGVLLAGTGSAAETANPPKGHSVNAFQNIRQIDYTVIFARDLPRMREFYEGIMEFPVLRTLGDGWIEFAVGSNRLALTVHGLIFNDQPPADGALSLQLAFRVPPAEVEKCAAALDAKGVKPISPVTDQAWGHRTVFFRDPDGNVIEIYAEI
ncbi:VOC family protein [Mesorhizobium sp. LHD-90]|uniref:VOC family protein n=1 Tax=Mesorhizobium sp. LHD-90 TaxID=3071414 RepID=UPI0027DFA9B0|nr:VOC family protein [Mesorhizobium sp. LHD-90]MDQ6437214.1 VOC family protein [Mesorhizobium sp. LHD-90]